jgi:hypothetical protein
MVHFCSSVVTDEKADALESDDKDDITFSRPVNLEGEGKTHQPEVPSVPRVLVGQVLRMRFH